MTFVAFLGPFLLGAGPLIAVFSVLVAQKSFVVLLSLASAFYWLTVLLGVALLLKGWTPLESDVGVYFGVLLMSVCLEQAAKYFLFRIWVVMTRLLGDIGRKTGHGFTSLDALWVSFGIGFGQAATHSTFFFVSLLEATSTGATHYDSKTCPGLSFNAAAALITLGISLYHAFSTIVFFEGLSSRNRLQSVLPPVGHFVVSLITLSNFGKNGCAFSIPIVLIVALVSVLWAGTITMRIIKQGHTNRTSLSQ